MKEKCQAYLDSLKASISVLTKLVKAADDNELARAEKLVQAARHIRKSEAPARAARLHVCA